MIAHYRDLRLFAGRFPPRPPPRLVDPTLVSSPLGVTGAPSKLDGFKSFKMQSLRQRGAIAKVLHVEGSISLVLKFQVKTTEGIVSVGVSLFAKEVFDETAFLHNRVVPAGAVAHTLLGYGRQRHGEFPSPSFGS
jgi:hypothetical protein